MAAATEPTLTVGDRQQTLRATLRIRNADGTYTVPTLTDVVLRMVSATAALTDTPKIDDAACAIESPGVVTYDWAAADVDTAGRYFLWFRDTNGASKVQTWPQTGRAYLVEFVPAG